MTGLTTVWYFLARDVVGALALRREWPNCVRMPSRLLELIQGEAAVTKKMIRKTRHAGTTTGSHRYSRRPRRHANKVKCAERPDAAVPILRTGRTGRWRRRIHHRCRDIVTLVTKSRNLSMTLPWYSSGGGDRMITLAVAFLSNTLLASQSPSIKQQGRSGLLEERCCPRCCCCECRCRVSVVTTHHSWGLYFLIN